MDYITNPEKTDDKFLVSGLLCEPELAFMQFKMVKKNADKMGGRLGYHLIQSFALGEVDYETAHEIGRLFAEKITEGKFQAVISTHVDKNHVHNHIIFNSVAKISHKKFNAPADIFNRIQRESDALCREFGLSAIEEKQKGKSKLRKQYYAEKVKQKGQEKSSKIAQNPTPERINLLIDKESSEKIQNSPGLEHWATIQNIKTIAKTIEYLTENGLLDYEELLHKHKALKSEIEQSRAGIKLVENRIAELKNRIEVIDNYRKYRSYSNEIEKRLWEVANRQIHEHLTANKKLPLLKNLRAELNALYSEKDGLYKSYYSTER